MKTNHNATIKFCHWWWILDVSQTPRTRCYRLRDLAQGKRGLPSTGKPCLVLFLEICLSFLIIKIPGEHQEVKYLFLEKRPSLPNVLWRYVGESLQKAARIPSCWVHMWLPVSAGRASFPKLMHPSSPTPWGLSMAQGRTPPLWGPLWSLPFHKAKSWCIRPVGLKRLLPWRMLGVKKIDSWDLWC